MLFIKPTTLLPSNRAFTFTLESMLVLLNLPHVPWMTVGNLQNNKIKIMLYRSFQLRDYIFFLIKKRFSCLVFMFPWCSCVLVMFPWCAFPWCFTMTGAHDIPMLFPYHSLVLIQFWCDFHSCFMACHDHSPKMLSSWLLVKICVTWDPWKLTLEAWQRTVNHKESRQLGRCSCRLEREREIESINLHNFASLPLGRRSSRLWRWWSKCSVLACGDNNPC